MTDTLYILAAYGICFGLMGDRAPGIALLRKVPFVERMLACAYCTGFHCGWMVWILRGAVEGFPSGTIATLVSVGVWSFAGAAACYWLDAVASGFSSSAPSEE